MNSPFKKTDTDPLFGDIYEYEDDYYIVTIGIYNDAGGKDLQLIKCKKKCSELLQPAIAISGKDVYLINSSTKIFLEDDQIDRYIGFLKSAKNMFFAVKKFVREIT